MNLLNRRLPIRLNKAFLFFLFAFLLSTISFSQAIQRVRVNFTGPDNSARQILLAFTPDNSATDNFDFGWDSVNWNSYSTDLNWMIDGYKCIIQGVGEFNVNKTYPFYLILGENGEMNIALHSLENFDETINVYIYDSLLDTFHSINDESFSKDLEAGEYNNRFYITFSNNLQQQASLSNSEFDKESANVKYIRNTKELTVNTLSSGKIKRIETFSINGQLINNYTAINTNSFKTFISSNSNQILIIRVTTDLGITSKKIMI